MTRRGAHNRYRPADLKRGIVRDGCSWPSRVVDPPHQPRALLTVSHQPAAPVTCGHGLPWTTYTACSTPRRAA